MGLNKAMIKYLRYKQNIFNYNGNAITLGRQDIGITQNEMYEIFGKRIKNKLKLTDVEFFKIIGFRKIDSLEFNKDDGATIAHDLNLPLHKSMYGKYDWVIDGGTLEHCFNVKEYMESIVNLLKPGGHILHINPAQGSCNHGFFNFQPTFYFSFYGANKFTNLECDFLEMQTSALEIFTNKNAKARVIHVNNWNNLDFISKYPTYSIFHAIKPLSESRKIKVPIQEFYYRIFQEKKEVGGGLIEKEIYMNIRGSVAENKRNEILKKSFWL